MKALKRIIITICFFTLFISSNTYAQCDPIDPGCEDPDPDAPLDSGVGLLLGAAAFYTVSRIRKKK